MLPPTNDRRYFLSWRRPLLPQAVEFLAAGWSGEGPLDLSGVLVVVPTRQAGRRLREALADFAAQRGQGVFAPRVFTPETFLGLGMETAVASKLASLLAWIAVLRDLPIDRFRAVFPADPPVFNLSWAVRVAREFGALQTSLVEGGLKMADVAARLNEGFAERLRWQQLGELESLQARELARAGLTEGAAARIAAADKPNVVGIEKIVVLATPDPLPLAVTALEAQAANTPLVIVIFAPEQEKQNFDEWGRPKNEAWSHRELVLPEFESHVHLHANPVAQAERLAGVAREYQFPEGLLAFGIADAEILPPLEGALLRFGIPVFNPEGRPRKQEALYQLLAALAGLLRSPTFVAVEALARCPDFIAYLRQQAGGDFSVAHWLGGLDQLQAKCLPADLAGARSQASKPGHRTEVLVGLDAIRALRGLLQQGSFGESATAALEEIYRGRKIDLRIGDGQHFESAAAAWMEVVHDCVEARDRFGDLPLDDWWELALQLFAETIRTDDKPEGALELQGWLELAWENAPHLIVAGLNDGRVPDAVVGDPFLPESLRTKLGLKTNTARLTRDAYLLQALAASRESAGRLDLVFGKTSIAGEPLRPSRLLLHCADDVLPSRVAFLFRAPETAGPAIPWTRAWRLKIRREKIPERIAVTGLKTWLICPFRFYLGQVLGMRAVDPAKNELDAMDFGTLCHGAVEGLVGEAMRDCSDEATLKNFLLSELDYQVRERYGSQLSLPLLVQLESARQRLAKAAEVQAGIRREGWVIIHVEKKIQIECGGLTISGRIDRIERHEKTDQVRVLDYKTSDTAVAPSDVHLRSLRVDEVLPDWARIAIEGKERVWADLQLPLYRHVLSTEFGADVICGYFNLPKAAGETGLALWEDFPTELQDSAMRCAEGICQSIRAGVFWPPNEKVKADYDDFVTLFHHGVAESVEWEEAK